MKYLIILLTIYLTSCVSIREYNTVVPFPKQNISTIEIRKLIGGDPDTLAYALIQGDKCTIYLRQYPKCLAHEVRHCYEGNWHEGRDSDEWCYGK